jgi:hypothetical protein
MTTEELLQAIDWIKETMIAVATGGPRRAMREIG